MKSDFSFPTDLSAGLDRFPVSFRYNSSPVRGFGEDFVLLDRTECPRGRHGTDTVIRLCHRPSGAELVLEW